MNMYGCVYVCVYIYIYIYIYIYMKIIYVYEINVILLKHSFFYLNYIFKCGYIFLILILVYY